MSLSNKYDSNIYVEPDGSSWVRIFHHNNPASSGMFANHTDTEWAASVYANENKWFDAISMINSITSPYEFMVKQKNTSSDSEFKVRWTQSYNPITTTDWNVAKPGTVTFNTSSGYTSSSMGGLYKNTTYSYFLIANASNGNSWGRVGSKAVYQGGFPGYPNNLCTTGYMDLYVRIDSLLGTSSEKGLQVWLPLTGSLENKGLNQTIGVSNAGAVADSSGKLGACYKFGTSTSKIIIDAKAMSGFTTEASVCFWIKINSWNTAWATYFQAGIGTAPWASYIMGFLRNNTNSTCCFTISSASTSSQANYLTPSLNLGQWYHIGLVYKAGHAIIYVDGVQTSDNTTSIVPNFNSISVITLGNVNANSYQSDCYMNDFRIYNQALSAKEVKEISKGLLLHYKLDEVSSYSNLVDITANYNIYNNYSVPASLTATGETYLGSPVRRLSMTPIEARLSHFRTSLSSHGVYNWYRTFSANTKYCFWIYYRPVSHMDVRVGGTASNISGWTEIPPEEIGNGWYRVGQYRNGSVTTDKSDNVFVSFYSPSAEAGVPILIDFACPTLIQGTTDIQDSINYTPNSGLALGSAGVGYGGPNLSSPYVMPGGNQPGNTSTAGRTQYYGNYGIKIPAAENADTYFTIWYNTPLQLNNVYTLSCDASGLLAGANYTFPLYAQGNTSMGVLRIDHNGRCFLTFKMTYTGTIDTTTYNGQTLYKLFLDDSGRSIPSGQGVITLTDFKLEPGIGQEVASKWAYNTQGTIETSADTGRYSASCYVNSSDNTTSTASGTVYLEAPCWLENVTHMTTTFWCKPIAGYGNTTSQGQFCFSYTGTGNDYNSVPMHHRDAAIDMTGTNGTDYRVGINFVANAWHHYAIVYDSNIAYVYQDGVKVGTSGAIVGPLKPCQRLIIGFSYAGGVWRSNKSYYSDFRVYGTALSDTDVLELYHTSASIDRDGNYYTRELVE